jgi:hypothetical protein
VQLPVLPLVQVGAPASGASVPAGAGSDDASAQQRKPVGMSLPMA